MVIIIIRIVTEIIIINRRKIEMTSYAVVVLVVDVCRASSSGGT